MKTDCKFKVVLACMVAIMALVAPSTSYAKGDAPDCPYEITKMSLDAGITICMTPYFEWLDSDGKHICQGSVVCLKYKNKSIVLTFQIKKNDSELSELLSGLTERLMRSDNHRRESISFSLRDKDNGELISTSSGIIGDGAFDMVKNGWNDVDEEEIFMISIPLQASRINGDKTPLDKVWKCLKNNAVGAVCVDYHSYYIDNAIKVNIPITFPLQSIINRFDYELKH